MKYAPHDPACLANDNGAVVYFVWAIDADEIKIGWTTRDPLVRLAELQRSSSSELTLLATVPGDARAEQRLHRRFAADRLHGEWFRPTARLIGLLEGLTHDSDGARAPFGDWQNFDDETRARMREQTLSVRGLPRMEA